MDCVTFLLASLIVVALVLLFCNGSGFLNNSKGHLKNNSYDFFPTLPQGPRGYPGPPGPPGPRGSSGPRRLQEDYGTSSVGLPLLPGQKAHFATNSRHIDLLPGEGMVARPQNSYYTNSRHMDLLPGEGMSNKY